jgi:hypothetical protein
MGAVRPPHGTGKRQRIIAAGGPQDRRRPSSKAGRTTMKLHFGQLLFQAVNDGARIGML